MKRKKGVLGIPQIHFYYHIRILQWTFTQMCLCVSSLQSVHCWTCNRYNELSNTYTEWPQKQCLHLPYKPNYSSNGITSPSMADADDTIFQHISAAHWGIAGAGFFVLVSFLSKFRESPSDAQRPYLVPNPSLSTSPTFSDLAFEATHPDTELLPEKPPLARSSRSAFCLRIC